MPPTTFTGNGSTATGTETYPMETGFTPPDVPLLVYTDLDGSLLDHDDYGFAAAQPALSRLRALHIPLIPVTSKTLAELRVLAQPLGLQHPLIVENGCVICLPDGYFPLQENGEPIAGYCLLRLAPDYSTLLAELQQLRNDHGFRFRGFHDMDTDEVARETGLSHAAAELARQRLCSEPLAWQDTGTALTEFRQALAGRQLRLVKGGRFWHVLSQADKGSALRQLASMYRKHGLPAFTSLALGDSPNDCGMLQAADIAAVIRHKDGSLMDCETGGRTIQTTEPGPAGWNTAVLQVLQMLSAPVP
jgi:mannosyl-3-phosphoglycerate phosphatase